MKKALPLLFLLFAVNTHAQQSKKSFTPLELQQRKQQIDYSREHQKNLKQLRKNGDRSYHREATAPASSFAITDTCEIMLQPQFFYATVLTKTGQDIYGSGSIHCGVLYHDLTIHCDSASGVVLDSATGELKIPMYNTVRFYNECDTFLWKKELFYLETHGLEFPYAMDFNSGHIINLVKLGMYGYNPAYWDSLKAEGQPSNYTYYDSTEQAWVPDTMAMYRAFVDDLDPWDDCATNVQWGFTDIYNNWFEFEDVPDATYTMEQCINQPGYIHDPGMYKNCRSRTISTIGPDVTYDVPLVSCVPPCSYNDVNSPTGCTADQAWGHGGDGSVSVSFNEVPGIDSVSFQRWYALGNLSGQNSGPLIKKAVSELFYDSTLHRYTYTFNPDFPHGGYRWYIKAHNCSGWSTTQSVTNPKLNVH